MAVQDEERLKGMDAAQIHTPRMNLRPLTVEHLGLYLVDRRRLAVELMASIFRTIITQSWSGPLG